MNQAAGIREVAPDDHVPEEVSRISAALVFAIDAGSGAVIDARDSGAGVFDVAFDAVGRAARSVHSITGAARSERGVPAAAPSVNADEGAALPENPTAGGALPENPLMIGASSFDSIAAEACSINSDSVVRYAGDARPSIDRHTSGFADNAGAGS
jgi:hypothetical protein